MTGDPGVTLESLDWEWGDAYLICYARDQWAALRRDTRRFLTAQTLDQLAARIDTDYAAHPVPREFGPPGTADYLDIPDRDQDEDEDLDEDEAPGRDGERLELLAGLRDAFPHWAISYAPFPRAWTARKEGATICQNTPALLYFALTLIERKERQTRHGPAGTGPRGPVASPLMPHPVTIECTRCGQVFTCDASSPAARDRTCGPCAIDSDAPETDHR